MTTDMIKTEITYKDGNQYVLDADFNNGSIITLVSHGNIYGRVKSEDSEWETMLNRLTEIPQWAKQYFQFTQQPKANTVTAWVVEVYLKNKLFGIERLTENGWEWMCYELNPDKGERWIPGVMHNSGAFKRKIVTKGKL